MGVSFIGGETGVHGQTLSHTVVLSTPHYERDSIYKMLLDASVLPKNTNKHLALWS